MNKHDFWPIVYQHLLLNSPNNIYLKRTRITRILKIVNLNFFMGTTHEIGRGTAGGGSETLDQFRDAFTMAAVFQKRHHDLSFEHS